jgi:hypothetical protein
MRVNSFRRGAALAVALMAVYAAKPAAAQQPAPAPAPVAAVPEAAELTVYTEAFLDIELITAELAPRIEAAQTEEEKAQLKQEAEERTSAVLEQREMEKERYEAIGKLIEANPELRAQFDAERTRIAEERKKIGG